MLIYGHLVSITFLSTYKCKAFSLFSLFCCFLLIYFINVSNIRTVIRSIDVLDSVLNDQIKSNLISIRFLRYKCGNITFKEQIKIYPDPY